MGTRRRALHVGGQAGVSVSYSSTGAITDASGSTRDAFMYSSKRPAPAVALPPASAA